MTHILVVGAVIHALSWFVARNGTKRATSGCTLSQIDERPAMTRTTGKVLVDHFFTAEHVLTAAFVCQVPECSECRPAPNSCPDTNIFSDGPFPTYLQSLRIRSQSTSCWLISSGIVAIS